MTFPGKLYRKQEELEGQQAGKFVRFLAGINSQLSQKIVVVISPKTREMMLKMPEEEVF